MKKSRIFSALLVLALLSTCVIGGTFAKYVASGEMSDKARVAKFGVTVSSEGTAFAKEYTTDNGTYVGTIANSVISTNDVVAPGTKGSMTKSAISGMPEVAVKVSYEATVDLSGWMYGSEFYCPLIFTITGKEYAPTAIDGKTFTSADNLEAAIKNAIEGYTQVYAPNTEIKADDSISVAWEWPFEVGSSDEEKAVIDAKDTLLGNAAAADNASEITLTVKTTVTQID